MDSVSSSKVVTRLTRQSVKSQRATTSTTSSAFPPPSKPEPCKKVDENFIGFEENDQLVQICKTESNKLTKTIRKIEQHLKRKRVSKKPLVNHGGSSSESDQPSKIVPLIPSETHNNSNNSLDDHDGKFIGFDENDPLLENLVKKQKLLHESSEQILYSNYEDELESKNSKPNGRSTPKIENTINNNMDCMELDTPSDSDSEGSTTKKQVVKRLYSDDRENLTKVKGARVKQVSRTSEYVKKLPILPITPIGHYKPSEISKPKIEKKERTLHCRTSGVLDMKCVGNGGIFDDTESDGEGETFFDLQHGEFQPLCSYIKAIVPLDLNDVAESGFPIITQRPFPPKPLCFLCGSAGEHLIFCSVCCEPYHPYCVGDERVMASIVKITTAVKTDRVSLKTKGKSKTQVEKQGYISDLTPPLTPVPDDDGIKEQFLTWTCHRCTLCDTCGHTQQLDDSLIGHKPKSLTKANEFIKCSQCRKTHHKLCLGKRYAEGLVEDFDSPTVSDGDDDDEQQKREKRDWICESCAECRSCKTKFENAVGKDKKAPKKSKVNSHMLCMKCFKQRQKGSFCPVCNVSYDDDDYETRMMECGLCNRWIHATCESMSEEQYQVLSHLPSDIEYICKICDNSKNPPWLEAIKMDFVNGYESILKVFTDKAVPKSLEPKALNFDDVDAQLKIENEKIILNVVKELQQIPSCPADVILSMPPKSISSPLRDRKINSTFSIPHSPSILDKCIIDRYSSIPLLESVGVQEVQESQDEYENDETITKRLRKSTRKPSTSSRPLSPRKLRNRNRKNSDSKKTKSPVSITLHETSSGDFVDTKHCNVKLRDVLKHPTAEAIGFVNKIISNEVQSQDQLCSPIASIENIKPNLELTPKKIPEISKEEILVPIISHTPSSKIACFTDMVREHFASNSMFSVLHFRDTALEILEEYYVDYETTYREKLRQNFCESIKGVFPWFDEDLLLNSDLTKQLQRVCELDSCQKQQLNLSTFQDVYWKRRSCQDMRICAFCSKAGDLPEDGCGRLICAGLTEWMHVNCALWSSEIWEGETGALQQVGQALNRSKNSLCSYCNSTGASVSCCQSQCHNTYHFQCALEANCAMKLNKTVFCNKHANKVQPDQVQYAFQVQRKVFVDLDWMRKKEKHVLSSQINVFIGSLKIRFFGRIIPLSAVRVHEEVDHEGTPILVPDGYTCQRFFWSSVNPWEKMRYTISASINKDWFQHFGKGKSEVHIVIDHSQPSLAKKKMNDLKAFQSWVNETPKLIDEYGVEWIPPCPLLFSSHGGSYEDEIKSEMKMDYDVDIDNNYVAAVIGNGFLSGSSQDDMFWSSKIKNESSNNFENILDDLYYGQRESERTLIETNGLSVKSRLKNVDNNSTMDCNENDEMLDNNSDDDDSLSEASFSSNSSTSSSMSLSDGDLTTEDDEEDSTEQEFLMNSSNIPQAMEEGNITVENLKHVIYDSGQQIHNRGDSIVSQKSEKIKPTATTGKSIKARSKRKENSYSINYQPVKDIKESELQTAGNMRSVKIRAKITNGEQAGMSTDMFVLPKFEDSHVVKPGLNAECVVKNPLRLTHKAVIVYEVKCQGVLLFRSSDVRAVWDNIFETVQGTRLQHNLPPLAYPATNISLPDDKRDAASFNRLGLTHRAVQFLLEQLPGTNSVVEKHKFRFHQPTTDEEPLLPVNESGCARTEGFKTRKPFDMFGWLASRQRAVPSTIDNPSDWGRQDLPIAMRYRNLREKASNSLGVFYSTIHGRGLFTRREYAEGEIIIEYAGELIRAVLSDRREKYYESRGIGCYFFTIDEKVVIDATVKGNAARFINHSCDPNCRSKIVEILGKKRILIFAIRKILGGEELTYDYKFAIEGTDKKIFCSCGAKKCRKYLN